jgi:23S rRNA pseudouridine1911/1915/1917 synthase
MSFIQKGLTLMPCQALHARSLGFTHPKTKKDLYFEVDPPENYKELLQGWENYSVNTLKR